MIDGGVEYRRPTLEELELLREPVVARVGFSSNSSSRSSKVVLVVAIVVTLVFSLDVDIVSGIVTAIAWISYASVTKFKRKEDLCSQKARSGDWWVCVGRIARVGGCDFPSCMNVWLISPNINGEFTAHVYQESLRIGDEVYIVCIECEKHNKLMVFTKAMLRPDVYSWFEY